MTKKKKVEEKGRSYAAQTKTILAFEENQRLENYTRGYNEGYTKGATFGFVLGSVIVFLIALVFIALITIDL